MRRHGPESRRRILAMVAEQPGIHKSDVGRRLGLAWGTVGYHVGVLQRQGHLRTYTHGRQVHLFLPAVPPQHMQWLSALRHDVGILSILAERSEARMPELGARLGLSRRTIRRRIESLAMAGLVRREGPARSRVRLLLSDLPPIPAAPANAPADGLAPEAPPADLNPGSGRRPA
jgi:predicted ArsR family transcriptional regulator